MDEEEDEGLGLPALECPVLGLPEDWSPLPLEGLGAGGEGQGEEEGEGLQEEGQGEGEGRRSKGGEAGEAVPGEDGEDEAEGLEITPEQACAAARTLGISLSTVLELPMDIKMQPQVEPHIRPLQPQVAPHIRPVVPGGPPQPSTPAPPRTSSAAAPARVSRPLPSAAPPQSLVYIFFGSTCVESRTLPRSIRWRPSLVFFYYCGWFRNPAITS